MTEIEVYQNLASNFEQEINLANRLMTLTITWNSRSEAFYLTLLDEDGNDILYGIKIVPDWLLLRQFRSYFPDFDGDFLVIKEDPNVEERITYENFGSGWKLYFVTMAEAEEWENTNGLG